MLHAHASRSGARLIVVLGAEAWCEKCRQFRTEFVAVGERSAKDVSVWLDLEDHAEFIGDYIPETLPLVMEFVGGTLVSASFLNDEPMPSLDDALSTNNARLDKNIAIGIFERLTAKNWAS